MMKISWSNVTRTSWMPSPVPISALSLIRAALTAAQHPAAAPAWPPLLLRGQLVATERSTLANYAKIVALQRIQCNPVSRARISETLAATFLSPPARHLALQICHLVLPVLRCASVDYWNLAKTVMAPLWTVGPVTLL